METYRGRGLVLRLLCRRIGLDLYAVPELPHFSKDPTSRHSSRAPESPSCHQIKFGNFNKNVPKETVN